MIAIVIGVICGVISAVIASSKGRNVVGWFFCGFLIGLIGLILVACLPNLKTQRMEQGRANLERQRLREQLRQERIKSESYRQYSMQRLDAHDNVLGVDTRNPAALPGAGPEAELRRLAAANQPAAPLSPGIENPGWYYESRGKALGPFGEETLRLMLQTGEIGGGTLVWAEGLVDWTRASQTQAFRREAAS